MAARTAASLTSLALICSSTMWWRWRTKRSAGAVGGGGGAGMAATRTTSAANAGRRTAGYRILPAIADPAGHRRQADGDDRPLLQAVGGFGDHQEVLDEAALGHHHLTAHPELFQEQLGDPGGGGGDQ